ncbi:unnamed protein product, partial [Cyprideis torosa]
IDDCSSSPCLHGGTCTDFLNGFECSCPPGRTGTRCEEDVDECSTNPCVHALSCINTDGDFICDCQEGWTGKRCHVNINDCAGHVCFNGGTSIDLIQECRCSCSPGFTGDNCETNVDECEGKPCWNGGECVDKLNGYHCICPVGYSGQHCEIDFDLCNPNPCGHGAPCFNMDGDYYCHCQSQWQGKNCTEERPKCTSPPCPAVDSCTVPIPSNESSLGYRLIPSSICGDHGRCVSLAGGQFSCTCDPGYTGHFCHQNIDDCTGNQCENGATCLDEINSYKCLCKEGWTGEHCAININECESNPCGANGKCIDSVADFVCECEGGWRGKRCHLWESHCDEDTCLNGGECVDLGDAFACHCPEGWAGSTCHRRKKESSRSCVSYSAFLFSLIFSRLVTPGVFEPCDSKPCLHGGTCVSAGANYSCLCKDGFKGKQCEENLDDCSPYPCYNGGLCKDGVNSFTCECPTGFTGPDCRLNVHQCASDPCAFGSTCQDIRPGEYVCHCPPGRTGLHCEEGWLSSPREIDWFRFRINCRCLILRSVIHGFFGRPCRRGSIIHPPNATWEEFCNTCQCMDGEVFCTRVDCGRGNCLPMGTSAEEKGSPVVCADQEQCLPVVNLACLSPPCHSWGECQRFKYDLELRGNLRCLPNAAVLDNGCATLDLLFQRDRLPVGTSVSSICSELQRFTSFLLFPSVERIHVECQMKDGFDDVIQIALASKESGLESNVTNVAQTLGILISRRRTDIPALMAVLEVQVETAVVSEEGGPANIYVILMLLAVSIIVALLVIVTFLLYRHRRARNRGNRHKCTKVDLAMEDVSNNQQNEENIKRVHNALKPLNTPNPNYTCLPKSKSLFDTGQATAESNFYRGVGKNGFPLRKTVSGLYESVPGPGGTGEGHGRFDAESIAKDKLQNAYRNSLRDSVNLSAIFCKPYNDFHGSISTDALDRHGYAFQANADQDLLRIYKSRPSWELKNNTTHAEDHSHSGGHSQSEVPSMDSRRVIHLASNSASRSSSTVMRIDSGTSGLDLIASKEVIV